MVPRAVVFVGPSLPPGYTPPAGLELRPPAESGAVLAAAAEGIALIGLVDGRFYQSLAVSPTELRAASAHGARLFGAASLGALRAVECPDVVEGIGEIWRAFRRGTLRSDDEVAETWDPATGRVLARPLVVLREHVAALVAEGTLDPAAARRILTRIRSLPFVDRDDPTLVAIVTASSTPLAADRLLARMRAPGPDVKQRDAAALLGRIEALIARQEP